MRATVRAVLRVQGWDVVEAVSPAEGITQAATHHPDVILLDVSFPGESRDGFAVCRELRSRRATSRTPIVLFTAHDDPENRALASAVGATAFIAKPFGPLDLVATLRLVIAGGSEPGVGLYLVDAGVITPAQLERALAEQRLQQGPKAPLGQIIVGLGYASQEDVAVALARERIARERPKSVSGIADIRIVIADDHPSVRNALRAAFTAEQGMSVVGLAIDGDDALRLVRTLDPDVLILDNEMPRRSGLEVLSAVRDDAPRTSVIIFTLDETVRDLALAAGAAAVVTKDQPLAVLVAKIRHAASAHAPRLANPGVVLAVRAVYAASGLLLRQKRRIAVMGLLCVAYAGGFLLIEPLLGASASLLGLVPVTLAGALFGPEAGIVAAVVSSVLTALLWQTTGHPIGEPILTVGGNGLGVLALVGIGGGFGVMRLIRGRLDAESRLAGAIGEAAIALAAPDPARILSLLTKAAIEAVRADGALLFLAVPGGGVELVAASGSLAGPVGSRERGDAVVRVLASEEAEIIAADRAALGVEVSGMRSAIVAPLVSDENKSIGAIVVLIAGRSAYEPADLAAMSSYAHFVGHMIAMRAAAPTAARVSSRVRGKTSEEGAPPLIG